MADQRPFARWAGNHLQRRQLFFYEFIHQPQNDRYQKRQENELCVEKLEKYVHDEPSGAQNAESAMPKQSLPFLGSGLDSSG